MVSGVPVRICRGDSWGGRSGQSLRLVARAAAPSPAESFAEVGAPRLPRGTTTYPMTEKQITLALASFMDSSHAVLLPAPATPEIRTIVLRLLEAAYLDQGKPPEELDGDALQELLGHHLPHRFDPIDRLAEHVPQVAEAWLQHLGEVAVVHHSFEQQMALAPGLDAFQRGMEQRSGPRRRGPSEIGTVTHRAEKTGRNDPCPCGSGLKYKKCHGR